MARSYFGNMGQLQDVLDMKYEKLAGRDTQRQQSAMEIALMKQKEETGRAKMSQAGQDRRTERHQLGDTQRQQSRQDFLRPGQEENIARSGLERDVMQQGLDTSRTQDPIKTGMLEQAAEQASYQSGQNRYADAMEKPAITPIFGMPKSAERLRMPEMPGSPSAVPNLTDPRKKKYDIFDLGSIGP